MKPQIALILAISVFGMASPDTKELVFPPIFSVLNATDLRRLPPLPPPTGREVRVSGLTVYETLRPNETKLMIVTLTDIFGLQPNVKYIADRLSEAGFFVIIPDLLHGNPIPIEGFPPPDLQERTAFLHAMNGSWVQNKPELLNVLHHYKQQFGITGTGLNGMCWGGHIAVFAASDADFLDNRIIGGIGLVHPSRVSTEEAVNVRVPALLLPSSTDPDMMPFLQILNKNGKSQPSELHLYSSVNHGFAGARGDFEDPQIRQNVEDVIVRLAKFFRQILS